MIRKIHLDFHTHPDTAGIGRNFDPEAFAETLAAAHVNYLATPGKCHFGNIYYDSKVGRAHPRLADPEMFPRTVAACRDRDIRVQAYWTLGLDAYAAVQRPEWRQRYADGTYGIWGHYLHMCFASPYIDEMVIPEVHECIERCPGLAGFWFDISLYVDGAFYSTNFERTARKRLGERADDVNARWELARQIIRERCAQIDAAIKTVLPEAENYFNSLVVPGEPQNIRLQPLQEVENPILFGGPEKLTTNARWLRGEGAETIGLVSRFQGPWSDPGTLRTPDQMRFDVARTVALGCHISMGDHRYPDGSLEPEVYRRLTPVYAEVADLEPLLDAARPCREAVLLAPLVSGSGKGLLFPDLSPQTQQAARLLEESGLQFDVVSVNDPLPTDIDLIIWPGEEPGSPELMRQLEVHVARGGALLAMHAALESPGATCLFGAAPLEAAAPRRKTDSPLTAEDGGLQEAAAHGDSASTDDMSSIGHVAGSDDAPDACGPSEQFVRLRPQYGGEPFSQILTGPTRLIEAGAEVDTLADRFEPVSAKPPFPGKTPAGPMIVQKGRVIYSAAPLFAESAETGSPGPARIIGALCDRLLPARLVRHNAGATVAAHLHETDDGYLLHLVHWALDRWGVRVNSAAQFPHLGNMTVALRIPQTVTQVSLQPQNQPIHFTCNENTCRFEIPALHVWQVVVLRT